MVRGIGQYWSKERRRSVRCRIDIASEFVFFSDMIVPDFPKRRPGWIRDLSALGLCADIDGIESGEIDGLSMGVIKIGIDSQIPHHQRRFAALARTAWIKERTSSDQPGYILGLEYVDIAADASDGIRDFIIQFYLGRESR